MAIGTDLCRVPYRRPDGELLTCQYRAGHPLTRHSWWTASVDDYRNNAQTLVDEIIRGVFDPNLEAILAAAHTRKRVLRGDR